jgi:hypothetical protein
MTEYNAMTENGALSHSSTNSSVLDLFFKVVRNTDESTVNSLMTAAWNEAPLLTLKAVFHLRDCRGGKGERARFYNCLHWLIANGHSDHVLVNLEHIPFYGSFKDLLTVFTGTELESQMLKYYAKILCEDINSLNDAMIIGNVNDQGHANVTLSLAAKWAPTEGGSFDKKHRLARKLLKFIREEMQSQYASTITVNNLKDYRKQILIPTRQHLNVVERYMCSMNWDQINFAHVPSVAMKNYRKAFLAHEEERFTKYLADVKSGKSKINAGQVFPHQLVKYYLDGGAYDETIELQWKEIVRVTANKLGANSAFPLVDVSGSMHGQPMEVAIALGLLLSETTCEQFRGSILTFTDNPAFFRVDTEDTLQAKVKQIRNAPWGMSTSLVKAFDLILTTAVAFKVSRVDMPKTLYIFSDMQFDQACSGNTMTNFEAIEAKYVRAGYSRPNIVFWNLSGRVIEFPVQQHVPKTALVSGFSPALMELFMSGEVVSPYAVMLKALTAPRYSKITLSDQSE